MTVAAPRLTNLPARLPPLIGRDEEIAGVKERLLAPEASLVTLAGVGGCGKTSLALRVARDLLAQFTDGVWLVELAPLADPSLVPQVVARVFGVQEGLGRTVTGALLGYLESRSALLVMDNCEHLVDACAQ